MSTKRIHLRTAVNSVVDTVARCSSARTAENDDGEEWGSVGLFSMLDSVLLVHVIERLLDWPNADLKGVLAAIRIGSCCSFALRRILRSTVEGNGLLAKTYAARLTLGARFRDGKTPIDHVIEQLQLQVIHSAIGSDGLHCAYEGCCGRDRRTFNTHLRILGRAGSFDHLKAPPTLNGVCQEAACVCDEVVCSVQQDESLRKTFDLEMHGQRTDASSLQVQLPYPCDGLLSSGASAPCSGADRWTVVCMSISPSRKYVVVSFMSTVWMPRFGRPEDAELLDRIVGTHTSDNVCLILYERDSEDTANFAIRTDLTSFYVSEIQTGTDSLLLQRRSRDQGSDVLDLVGSAMVSNVRLVVDDEGVVFLANTPLVAATFICPSHTERVFPEDSALLCCTLDAASPRRAPQAITWMDPSTSVENGSCDRVLCEADATDRYFVCVAYVDTSDPANPPFAEETGCATKRHRLLWVGWDGRRSHHPLYGPFNSEADQHDLPPMDMAVRDAARREVVLFERKLVPFLEFEVRCLSYLNAESGEKGVLLFSHKLTLPSTHSPCKEISENAFAGSLAVSPSGTVGIAHLMIVDASDPSQTFMDAVETSRRGVRSLTWRIDLCRDEHGCSEIEASGTTEYPTAPFPRPCVLLRSEVARGVVIQEIRWWRTNVYFLIAGGWVCMSAEPSALWRSIKNWD